jgi:hypothetical protein
MDRTFPVSRSSWIGALALAVLGLVVAPGPGARAASLEESILESKYRRGDYGIYLGGYRPNDWQFREHADVAYPVGLKVRFRLGEGTFRSWLRFEGDISYYRRANEPVAGITAFQQPEFDGLQLAVTLQAILPSLGPLRPYAGGGPVFVSLGNDFIVWRQDIYEVAPDDPNQYALANWKKFDVGAQVVAGVDIPLGFRAFPFVEYRQLFGVVGLTSEDIKISGLSLRFLGLEPEDIQTPPEREERDQGGRPYESRYDWSGPSVLLGLKILF